jgi:hypothetical protein
MGMVILLAKAQEELRPNMGYLLDKEPHSVPYYIFLGTTDCRVIDGSDCTPTGTGERGRGGVSDD